MNARAFMVPCTGPPATSAAPAPPPATFPFSFGSASAVRPQPLASSSVVTRTGRPATPPHLDERRSTTPTFSDDPSPAYLGTSPPNPTDHAWGMGICGFMLQIAIQLGNTPAVRNVLAYHTLMVLSPGDRHGLAHQYHLFFDMAICMFSIRGLFARIIELGGYPAASLPMAHYPYPTDNITMAQVAAWFVQHGIAPGAVDIGMLQSFAHVRRNMVARITDLNNNEWMDVPQNSGALQLLSAGDVPRWADLRHAPVPSATATVDAPITGRSGLGASMHAPTPMEVEPTTVPPSPCAGTPLRPTITFWL
ncbi:hypothetical protein FB451DRAFT_1385217 [Mycena latifolia]|nr:hypothetical protein FB451DRAFT_1385217 [Mycena latifolia]